MGLSLIAGPANAGKVALLLERYLAALAREPVLIVPNRSDVERVERDLLARSGALLGGSIGTFDDVFERIAQDGADARPLLGDAQRTLLVRRIVGGASLNGLGRSARFAGFADSLATTFGELESGLLEPSAIDGDLARLFAAYRAELDRLKRWDRDALRRHAVDRLQSEFTRLKVVEAPEQPSSHVVFVPTPERYLLLERQGPPPDPGDELELSEGRFVVGKLGRAPFPGERRPCVFLLAT